MVGRQMTMLYVVMRKAMTVVIARRRSLSNC